MTKTRSERIDDCLSVRNGKLLFERCDATELACRFGTPIYVLSEDQLRRNVRRFAHAFHQKWPEAPVQILPSIKANFTLALLRILADEGTGCDTFGPGELSAALRAGISPRLISVNGSVKTPALIERALTVGARITLDSAAEVAVVREVAKSLGVRAKVRFRLRPRYDGLDRLSDFYDDNTSIRVAAQQYKAGIPTEELRRIGPEALAAPELDVSGVMVHLGRHSGELDVWRGMVRSFVAVLGDLSKSWGGWEPREIDLGGGFPSRRDPTGRNTRRGRLRPPDEKAPAIEDYAAVLTETLRAELLRHGMSAAGKTLEVEPGRSLFADAGIHLTTVRGVKTESAFPARTWIETDTTEMFLLDTLVEHNRWTTVVTNKADTPASRTADIVGISCGFDVIVDQAALPDVEVGDVLAFLDTGAYQDACANNFNALPRPGVLLVHGADAEIVKRPETIEDVFRRDTMPVRLGRIAPSEVSQ